MRKKRKQRRNKQVSKSAEMGWSEELDIYLERLISGDHLTSEEKGRLNEILEQEKEARDRYTGRIIVPRTQREEDDKPYSTGVPDRTNPYVECIVPALKSKCYDLLITEDAPEIYSFPFLTKEFCKEAIDVAVKLDAWTEGRHQFYSTNDILLEGVNKQLYEKYVEALQEYIFPLICNIWNLDGSWAKQMTHETFLIRYTLENQTQLDLHHVHADFTVTAVLNDEFTGGGTWYPKQKYLAKPKVGEGLVFPSITHRHGGRPITDGVRFVLVTFCLKERNDYGGKK